MFEPVSILDVIKRGGYEASLLTTFNATLPFYEEVLLRKLVGAGCRHNVVLMDRSQCAISWSSEMTRPRLAGHAYTLLPIGAPGAFHPKLCILVGPKKASVLIGSHNLTLSGFGFNREVTNWIEVSGPKDTEGGALLADAWRMASQWIEMERGKTSDHMIGAALALANFISPLVVNAERSKRAFALTHTPLGPPLFDQISDSISFDVRRIAIVGAFFDKEFGFIDAVGKRWPKAQVVVGVDPDSVQMLAAPPSGSTCYVDVRKLWPEQHRYMHAKMLWFDSGGDSGAFVSGSANPSRPAWMGPPTSSNVEAVLLRLGRDAHEAAESLGLLGIFDLDKLDPSLFKGIAIRSATEIPSTDSAPVPLWTGIASGQSSEIRIGRRGSKAKVDLVILFNASMETLGEIGSPQAIEDDLIIVFADDIARVRSCLLYANGALVARAMIHHPELVSASSQSSRQHQIRTALSGLGSSEGDISKVIASVERVIFSDETQKEMEAVLREAKAKHPDKPKTPGPESLAVSTADLPKEKKKIRLLKSGDLAYLLDVLLHHLKEGLDRPPPGVDASGLTEEGLVGTEGSEVERPAEPILPPTSLSDSDVARAVCRRARALTRRMVDQLRLASSDHSRRASSLLQLIAVLALVRELRHLDKTPRWKATGQLLVEEKDRRYLLDESLTYLLGSSSRMLAELDSGDVDTEEGAQLRVLLVWLAWDLGEELTEQIGRHWDTSEQQAKLRANATFLKLLPPIAEDAAARAELEQSISRTVRQTPEASLRASKWLQSHLQYGAAWARGVCSDDVLQVGGYCRVPGVVEEPRIVLAVTEGMVDFWDYDKKRSFSRDRVVAVAPA
ncbi:hypothetical protein M6I34_08220 [Burkholderiaceae bacterium FT117]|uniref:hypothetical protein n=1 Tax=Zeimonas sediminis TaxID=2944268 RepID=UPI0023431017|nr:hypothetical protein [Zeimonas sediminis]MCM5570491.1 hypothetical protein [Zeimonas sediminis]